MWPSWPDLANAPYRPHSGLSRKAEPLATPSIKYPARFVCVCTRSLSPCRKQTSFCMRFSGVLLGTPGFWNLLLCPHVTRTPASAKSGVGRPDHHWPPGQKITKTKKTFLNIRLIRSSNSEEMKTSKMLWSTRWSNLPPQLQHLLWPQSWGEMWLTLESGCLW